MGNAWSSLAGAVWADDGSLDHLGSPMAEQRALAAGNAVVPRADLAVLAVGGEDRLSWLDSVTSQALATLPAGQSTEMLILDPQGHIEHAAAVLDDGQTTWLIVDRGDAEPLLEWLRRMRFRLRVDPRDASTDSSVVTVLAARADAVPAAQPAGIPLVWNDPWPGIAPGSVGYAAVEPHPGAEAPMAQVIVDASAAQLVRAQVDDGLWQVAGVRAAEALRVAAWRPRWRSERDERMLPHEVDWLRTAVHLSKGCYRGQETVAKVHNLGHPPRRLVAVHLDGSDNLTVVPGDELRSGGDVIGWISSVAEHYELGPIALAVVTRRADTTGELLVDTADGAVAASAETIVPPDAGAAASVPRMPRLSHRR